MEYAKIRHWLGETWLKNQIKMIEERTWIKLDVVRNDILTEPAYFMLNKINDIIGKLEHLEGFSRWADDIREDEKNFADFIFELLVFENLSKEDNELIIKPENNGKYPDALLKTKNDSFYIEVKNIHGVPSSQISKANRLLTKTRNQFGPLKKGFLFIGCFGFFIHQKDSIKIKSELEEFKKEIERKLNNARENRRIRAVVLTNFYIETNFQDSSLQKYFYLVPRPEFDEKHFREIFNVDEFVTREDVLREI